MSNTKIETTNDLIIQALFLINEYAPNELPKDDEVRQGIISLNTMLEDMSGDGIFIPYTTSIDFTMVAGQASYLFSREAGADVDSNKIVELTDVILHYNGVDIPITVITHDQAYQLVRYPNATTRPTQVFQQNTNTGTNLIFFYTPDQSYSVTIKCKVVLDDLDLQQSIDNVPPHYKKFLLYGLARELSLVFENDAWGERHESEYARLYERITSNVDTDWSINTSAILMKRYAGWTKGSIIVG